VHWRPSAQTSRRILENWLISVDVVLSCLADAAAVEGVYLGTNGVLRTAKPGTVIIEMSTVAPETSQKPYQAAHRFEISVLDVPISGSTPAAEAGRRPAKIPVRFLPRSRSSGSTWAGATPAWRLSRKKRLLTLCK
jgi:NAD binding domain of 6-phosphogluconate dehydrogenase